MRDRLIKLLQDNSYLDVLDDEHWLLAAEQLLASGVVVVDTDVVSLPNRPLISQYMDRPIDEVINLIRRSEWISVEERLPTENGDYLVYTKYGYIEIERYKMWDDDDLDGGYWWELEGHITHWMPLPEVPKTN